MCRATCLHTHTHTVCVIKSYLESPFWNQSCGSCKHYLHTPMHMHHWWRWFVHWIKRVSSWLSPVSTSKNKKGFVGILENVIKTSDIFTVSKLLNWSNLLDVVCPCICVHVPFMFLCLLSGFAWCSGRRAECVYTCVLIQWAINRRLVLPSIYCLICFE